MDKPNPRRVVAAYLAGLKSTSALSELREDHEALRGMVRTAGEVRHVKDNTGDQSQWAYSLHHPVEREMDPKFNWDPQQVSVLANILRSTSAALGHAVNAQNKFAQLKSRNVSPDGRLGGRGYIQRVADMRRQFFNVVEALSALSDTLYDEVEAPHWASVSRDAQEVIEHAKEIRKDPEGWAEEEISEDQEERAS